MNKFILSLVIVITSLAQLTAQENTTQNTDGKRQYFVGGAFNMSAATRNNIPGFTNNETSLDLNFGISPYVGLQLNENNSIGVFTGFNVFAANIDVDDDATSFSNVTWSAGLFSRHRLYNANKLTLFVQPQTRFTQGYTRINTNDQEQSSRQFSLGATLGGTYEFNDRFRAIMTLGNFGYTHVESSLNTPRPSTSNVFDFSLNASTIRFGIELKL